jgi:hypothetical protein
MSEQPVVQVKEELHRVADVPLGGNRTCRLVRTEGALILSIGFGGGTTGDPFVRPSWESGPLHPLAQIIPKLIRRP